VKTPRLNRLGRLLPAVWQQAILRRSKGLGLGAIIADEFLECPPDPRGFDPVGTKLTFESATRRLAELRLTNVSVLHGDGTLGWPEHAPYDAIVVAADGPKVPEALLEQLAVGGRLVIPMGEGKTFQELVRLTREADGTMRRDTLSVWHEELGKQERPVTIEPGKTITFDITFPTAERAKEERPR